MNLFVSKLGNDSDGSSWATAFRTVQQALCAVPDDGGGHTITIRPDTYRPSIPRCLEDDSPPRISITSRPSFARCWGS